LRDVEHSPDAARTEASGVDFHTRGRRFEQMLAQWQAIWAGELHGRAPGARVRGPGAVTV
jgi:hypothetical protein